MAFRSPENFNKTTTGIEIILSAVLRRTIPTGSNGYKSVVLSVTLNFKFLCFLLHCLFYVHFPQVLIQSILDKRAEEMLLPRVFSYLFLYKFHDYELQKKFLLSIEKLFLCIVITPIIKKE